MSLFQSLRALYQPGRFMLEDFHTEIVARVLQNSPRLVFAWLQSIGATSLDETKARITVRSQQAFPALKGHDRGSRIDLTIRLQCKDSAEIIFVESKVGSQEGQDQLQHYADHLAMACQEEGVSRGILVYVTRDFEVVDPPRFDPSSKCVFLEQTRWFVFYRQLLAHVGNDTLAAELVQFMKENNMSLGNRFRPIDLVALQNFIHGKSLMDEVLEAIKQRSVDVVGVKPLKRSRTMAELQKHRRYILQFALGSGKDFEMNVGFWFTDEGDSASPWVGVELQSNPGSPMREDIRKAFSSLSSSTWERPSMKEDDEWWGVYRGDDLIGLLAQRDHLEAIKSLMRNALDEVEKFQKDHQELPWGTASKDDKEESSEE